MSNNNFFLKYLISEFYKPIFLTLVVFEFSYLRGIFISAEILFLKKEREEEKFNEK